MKVKRCESFLNAMSRWWLLHHCVLFHWAGGSDIGSTGTYTDLLGSLWKLKDYGYILLHWLCTEGTLRKQWPCSCWHFMKQKHLENHKVIIWCVFTSWCPTSSVMSEWEQADFSLVVRVIWWRRAPSSGSTTLYIDDHVIWQVIIIPAPAECISHNC